MLETGSPAPSLPQLLFRFGRVEEAQIWDPWGKGRARKEEASWASCVVAMGRRKGLGFEVGDVGISKAQDTMPSSEELLSKYPPMNE